MKSKFAENRRAINIQEVQLTSECNGNCSSKVNKEETYMKGEVFAFNSLHNFPVKFSVEFQPNHIFNGQTLWKNLNVQNIEDGRSFKVMCKPEKLCKCR